MCPNGRYVVCMEHTGTNSDTIESHLKPHDNARIAAEVRAAVTAANCTKAEFARTLGISRATAERRLRGEREFTATELGVIAWKFGVAADRLVGLKR